MTTDVIMGIAGIAIGILTSYVFYEIQKRKKEVCWSIDSNNLIKGYSSLFEKLEIQYAGEKIENLTVSKIVFWNNGNETINRTEIAVPPFIIPEDEKNTKILEVKVLATSTIGNKFKAYKIDNKQIVVLDFEYIDPQQGAVIQIVHTGVSDLPLFLEGEIKGTKGIIYKRRKRDIIDQIPRFIIYVYGTISLAGFAQIFLNKSLESSSFYNLAMWSSLALFVLTALFAIIDFNQRKRVAKIPSSLLVFDKNDT